MNNKDWVADELRRVRVLMQPDRARVELQEVPADPSARSVGAHAGLGFRADAPTVAANVYVFDAQSQHSAVAQALSASVSSDGMKILTASNGRLLFFGYTRIDGEDGRRARFRLADLVSAFAGDE